MARVTGWTISPLALCFVSAMACVPPGESPSSPTAGSGGSKSATGGRGGSSPGSGGTGGSVAGGDATGGAAGSGSGGSSSTGAGGAGGRGGASGGSAGSGGSSGDASTGQPPDMPVAAAAPTLSGDVLPIVKANCARSGCHDPMKKEHGMDVSTAAGIMSSWVNRQTADHCKGNATVTRVVPLKPESSFVVTLISATLYCNEVKRMPPPPLPTLTADQIKTIRDWITAGAKND